MQKEKIDKNPNVLIDIIKKEVSPYLNSTYASYYILASKLRTLPKSEIKDFVIAFEDYYIYNVASMFTFYNNQEILFQPYVSRSETSAVINIDIIDENLKKTRLSLNLRKDRNTGDWFAYDLSAEGVSLLSSKRSEFSSYIRQHGIQETISFMKETIKKPLLLENKG